MSKISIYIYIYYVSLVVDNTYLQNAYRTTGLYNV